MKEPPASGTLARIVGHSPVRLWGLSSEERLRRQLTCVGIEGWLDGETTPARGSSVLLVRADYLYDERILAEMVKSKGILLRRDDAPVFVAAHVPLGLVEEAERSLLGRAATGGLPGVEVRTPHTLSTGYVRELHKFEPATVLPIDAAQRDGLERHLFDGAYKGVTDLVTKWVWPLPARWVAGVCARLGIRPNHVTLVSLILALSVIWLFADGRLALGLVLAWVMTFLDTVDGKLARVTVDSSTFGHYLDHGLDLIHPPLWYLAWGIGLSAFEPPVSDLAWPGIFALILVGYLAGRLVEGYFHYGLTGFSIFCWYPLDSYFRLIVARRNPNLLLLSAGWVAGRPDAGLVAVAAWTVLSALALVARLALAARRRATSGPLRSWLEEPHLAAASIPLSARPFVHPARAASCRAEPTPEER